MPGFYLHYHITKDEENSFIIQRRRPNDHIRTLHRTAKLGDFLGNIPHPLGLGEITLCDGRKVTGFLCDKYSAEQGRDLTGEGAFVLS